MISLLLLLSALVAVAFAQRLRIVHTIVGVNVDVELDTLLVLEGSPYGTISEFRPVAEGSHTVNVYQAGTTTLIATLTANLQENYRYTFVATDVSGTPALQLINHGAYVPTDGGLFFIGHFADAGAVQIVAGGVREPAAGLQPGQTATINLDVGAFEMFNIVESGTNNVLVSNVPVPILSGVETAVFVMGDAAQGVSSPVVLPAANGALAAVPALYTYGINDVRFVHAFPASVAVDIWVSLYPSETPNRKVADAIVFGGVTDYVLINTGELYIWVAEAGTNNYLINKRPFNVEFGGARQTVVVLPAAGSGTADLAIVSNGQRQGLSPAAARLSVLHAVVGAPSAQFALAGATTPLGTINYGQMQTWQSVPAGTLAFEVRVGGNVVANVNTDLPVATETVILLIGNATAAAGSAYTIQQRSVREDVAWVRALHGVPGGPAVTIALGPFKQETLAYQTVSDFVAIPANRAVTVSLLDAQTDNFLLSFPITIARDQFVTAAAIGNLTDTGAARFRVAPFVTNSQVPAAGQGLVRAIHAVVYAPPVDIDLNPSTSNVSNLAFGDSTGYVPVNAGVYTANARLAGTTSVVGSLNVNVNNARASTVAAVGSLRSTFALLQFEDAVVRQAGLLDLAAMANNIPQPTPTPAPQPTPAQPQPTPAQPQPTPAQPQPTPTRPQPTPSRATPNPYSRYCEGEQVMTCAHQQTPCEGKYVQFNNRFGGKCITGPHGCYQQSGVCLMSGGGLPAPPTPRRPWGHDSSSTDKSSKSSSSKSSSSSHSSSSKSSSSSHSSSST